MKPWSTFYRAITTQVPGVPTFTMDDAIKRAAQEFYRLTRAWRVEGVTLATTVAAQRDYIVITNPADAVLVGLPAVWIGDTEVKELAPGDSDDTSTAYTDTTFGVGVVGDALIRLAPAPMTAGDVIKATAAYAPADTATGLSDQLYADHRRGIEHAALAILLTQKARPWYDPALASNHDWEAGREMQWAMTMAGGRSRNPLRSRPA